MSISKVSRITMCSSKASNSAKQSFKGGHLNLPKTTEKVAPSITNFLVASKVKLTEFTNTDAFKKIAFLFGC